MKILSVVLLLVLLCDPMSAGRAGTVPKNSAGLGPAPSFSLETRDGKVSLDSLRGRYVYVDFWASWCDPCKKSFPWLNTLQERYSSKGLRVVAINLDKKRDAADAFLERNPAEFLIAYDPSGKTAEAFKVTAMPSSFLIDPSGAIVFAHAGFDPKKTISIETLIKGACSP